MIYTQHYAIDMAVADCSNYLWYLYYSFWCHLFDILRKKHQGSHWNFLLLKQSFTFIFTIPVDSETHWFEIQHFLWLFVSVLFGDNIFVLRCWRNSDNKSRQTCYCLVNFKFAHWFSKVTVETLTVWIIMSFLVRVVNGKFFLQKQKQLFSSFNKCPTNLTNLIS